MIRVSVEHCNAVKYLNQIKHNRLYLPFGLFMTFFTDETLPKTMAYAFRNGILIGVGAINYRDDWIGCFVAKPYRNQGIAKRLITRLDAALSVPIRLRVDETLAEVIDTVSLQNVIAVNWYYETIE